MLVEIANQQDVYLSWHQGEQKIEVVARKILDLIDKKLVVETLNSCNEPRDSPLDLKQLGQAVVEQIPLAVLVVLHPSTSKCPCVSRRRYEAQPTRAQS